MPRNVSLAALVVLAFAALAGATVRADVATDLTTMRTSALTGAGQDPLAIAPLEECVAAYARLRRAGVAEHHLLVTLAQPRSVWLRRGRYSLGRMRDVCALALRQAREVDAAVCTAAAVATNPPPGLPGAGAWTEKLPTAAVAWCRRHAPHHPRGARPARR